MKSIWNHKYDFRAELLDMKFIQLPFYYSHFEITKFRHYQNFNDLVAGLLKSGNKKAFTSHFVFKTEMMRYLAKNDAI